MTLKEFRKKTDDLDGDTVIIVDGKVTCYIKYEEVINFDRPEEGMYTDLQLPEKRLIIEKVG